MATLKGLRYSRPGECRDDEASSVRTPCGPEGCEALAKMFNQLSDQRIHFELEKKYIYWHIEQCPLCWEGQAEGPYCALAIGFLQEALYWVSGGKYFLVEEKKCIAFGDSECTIVIDQTPIS